MIIAVNTGEPQPEDQILDGWIIPGMPNLHSHAFQYLLAGRTGYRDCTADSFWTWREQMYRLVEKLQPQQFEAVTAWCQLQLLKGGYTSVAEFHYVHNDKNGSPYAEPAEMANRVISAASRAGIGLTLLPVLYCHSGFGNQPLQQHQAAFSNSLESYLEILQQVRQTAQQQDLLFAGAAPHSLRAVSKAALDELLAELPAKIPLHIHIAEQQNEIDDCLQFHNQRPLAWLLEHLPVDESWCLVHATHTTAEELGSAARSGATAGLCPTTEADLGDGIFAAVDWQNAGGAWGIGSDSNLRTSVADELRLLEFTQRLRDHQRNLMAIPGRCTGDSLFDAALAGGAQAIGQPVGRIEAGYRADLVQLDKNHPLLAGDTPDSILDRYIFANSDNMIRRVLVAGNAVIEDGRHINEDSLRAGFDDVVRELY
jgi:formimidoylglutamate deiminase